MLRAAIVGGMLFTLPLAACSPQVTAPAAPTVTAAPAETAMKLEDQYANDDGVKIHYVVSGPADAPLVVMIHGFPDYSETWAQLTPVLNDAYRTAAIDTRGYNLSDQPKGVENYDMTKLVADIAAVIKNEGRDKAIVIGHDWGAAQAWAFEFAHPEMVDKLIILSVPHPTAFAHELATNKAQYEASLYARNFQKAGSEDKLTADGLAGWVEGSRRTRQVCRSVPALRHRGDDELLPRQLSERHEPAYRRCAATGKPADQRAGDGDPRPQGSGAARLRSFRHVELCHQGHHAPDDPRRGPFRAARRCRSGQQVDPCLAGCA